MYIGKTPTVGNFQVCDAISVVNGQAAYTLQVGGVNVAPESANHMLVSLNGILQKPGSSFTISGSTMTFASNLATGDVIDFVQILGNVLDLGQPSDDTVKTASIQANAVTTAKLSTALFTGATDIGADIADADLFLMDDGAGGTIRKTAASRLKTYAGSAAGTLNFQANRSSDLSVSATTQTEIVFNAEQSDTDGKYDTSTGRYTPGVAGAYFVTASLSFAPGANVGVGASGYIKIRKNGSGSPEYGQTSNQGSGDSNDESFHASAIIECDSDDYISVWWYHTATAGTHLSVQSWFSGFRLD